MCRLEPARYLFCIAAIRGDNPDVPFEAESDAAVAGDIRREASAACDGLANCNAGRGDDQQACD